MTDLAGQDIKEEETKLNNMTVHEVLRYVNRSNPEVKRLAEIIEALDLVINEEL